MARKIGVVVSVVIANNRVGRMVNRCVDSVLAGGSNAELIIVNNGLSGKGVERIEGRYGVNKKVRVINMERASPVMARNMGARLSKGKYLVFLDNDTEVEKGWLGEVIEYMEKNKRVGAGQLKLLQMDRRENYDSAGEKLTKGGLLVERARAIRDEGQFDEVEDIFSGKGAAMLVRREVFEKVGGFDKDYVYYWEEPDLCWRVWKAGYRVVFLPMTRVWHAYGSKKKVVSRERLVNVTYYGCRNHLMTIAKNGVGLRGIWMFAVVWLGWVGIAVMFVIKRDIERFRAVVRAWGYLIVNASEIYRKRKQLQKLLGKRYGMDGEWFERIMQKRRWKWYFGKGVSYVRDRAY